MVLQLLLIKGNKKILRWRLAVKAHKIATITDKIF